MDAGICYLILGSPGTSVPVRPPTRIPLCFESAGLITAIVPIALAPAGRVGRSPAVAQAAPGRDHAASRGAMRTWHFWIMRSVEQHSATNLDTLVFSLIACSRRAFNISSGKRIWHATNGPVYSTDFGFFLGDCFGSLVSSVRCDIGTFLSGKLSMTPALLERYISTRSIGRPPINVATKFQTSTL